MSSTWHPVIGLEVHIQLQTKTKLFSSAPTAYGAKVNTQANRVDLALPGTLPVLNQEALDLAIIFGIATHSKVNQTISFDRKNYFYPDLPKGYQITQHYQPILSGGHLDIELGDTHKRVRLHHTHLEEDAGKSLHNYSPSCTGIDLNRAGTPLLEVVTEPDLRSTEEAVAFLKTLHHLVVSAGICDGNMQEGSFRCDANISLRAGSNAPFGTRVEIKNVNSFKFVEKALMYEMKRQAEILSEGGTIKQQTRLYHEASQTTQLMREKEQAHDYRYHTDPDIPAITIATERIERLRANMPELPHQKRQRYIEQFELADYEAKILASDHDLSCYFESLCERSSMPAPNVANWLLGPVSALMNKLGRTELIQTIDEARQAELLNALYKKIISNTIAKNVLELMLERKEAPLVIIEEEGLMQIQDPAAIQELVDAVLAENPKQVGQYQQGAEKLFGFFVGKVMKASQGKAEPVLLNSILKQRLGNAEE